MNKHFIRILQEIMVALLDEASSLPEGLMEEVLLDRLNHYQNVSTDFLAIPDLTG
jgi:hypothetical protein